MKSTNQSIDRLQKEEVDMILGFVENGGSILITHPQTPTVIDLSIDYDLHLLAEKLVIEFPNVSELFPIEDEEHHDGRYWARVIISEFEDHPITQGVNQIHFGPQTFFAGIVE